MKRKQKVKKFFFILFVIILVYLLFKYRKMVGITFSEYYFVLNTNLGKFLSNAIIICVGSVLSILVCWGIGKCKDKKLGYVGGSFSSRHPRLNMIIGLALVVLVYK